jgi:hypothetical protein
MRHRRLAGFRREVTDAIAHAVGDCPGDARPCRGESPVHPAAPAGYLVQVVLSHRRGLQRDGRDLVRSGHAQVSSGGPVGAALAAWLAASLVGSYQLLLWLVGTAATGVADREPTADQKGEPADHLVRELRLVPMPHPDAAEHHGGQGNHAAPGEREDRCAASVGAAGRTSGPDWAGPDQAYRSSDQEMTGLPAAGRAEARGHVRQDLTPLGPQPHGRRPPDLRASHSGQPVGRCSILRRDHPCATGTCWLAVLRRCGVVMLGRSVPVRLEPRAN